MDVKKSGAMARGIHWGRGSNLTPRASSVALWLTFGKGFTAHFLFLVFQVGLETGGTVSVHTLKFPSDYKKNIES